MKILKYNILIFILFFLFIPLQTPAGDFKIIPARIFLNEQKKTDIFRITSNPDEKTEISQSVEKSSFQVNAVKWTQDENGNDRYEVTEDILFFPKIFTLENGGEIMIRVGHKFQKPVISEKTYRLFIRELPVSDRRKETLRMTVNIGVPVFVAPAEEIRKISVENISAENGKLLVKIRNSGNTHSFVNKIHITGFDENNTQVFSKTVDGWYVLPGVLKTFSVPFPAAECIRTKKIQTVAETDETEAVLNTDSVICTD